MFGHIIPITQLSRTGPLAFTNDPNQLGCQKCDSKLEWHQPDIDDADRLLGICSECRVWHILDLPSEDEPVVFAVIPRRGAKKVRSNDRRRVIQPARRFFRRSAQRH